MDGIFWTIVIGFIVGIIAKFLMPGRGPSGFIITTLLGIGGSVLGSYLARALGIYSGTETTGFVISVIGAMLIIFIYHLGMNRRAVLK